MTSTNRARSLSVSGDICVSGCPASRRNHGELAVGDERGQPLPDRLRRQRQLVGERFDGRRKLCWFFEVTEVGDDRLCGWLDCVPEPGGVLLLGLLGGDRQHNGRPPGKPIRPSSRQVRARTPSRWATKIEADQTSEIAAMRDLLRS